MSDNKLERSMEGNGLYPVKVLASHLPGGAE
jgi:hypothetical protein